MYASHRLLCTQTDGDDAQKKTTTYKEQDPVKVTHYLTQLAEFSDYQRVHIVEEEVKSQVDPAVYEEQVGMMEMVLDVDAISEEMKDVRGE